MPTYIAAPLSVLFKLTCALARISWRTKLKLLKFWRGSISAIPDPEGGKGWINKFDSVKILISSDWCNVISIFYGLQGIISMFHTENEKWGKSMWLKQATQKITSSGDIFSFFTECKEKKSYTLLKLRTHVKTCCMLADIIISISSSNATAFSYFSWYDQDICQHLCRFGDEKPTTIWNTMQGIEH